MVVVNRSRSNAFVRLCCDVEHNTTLGFKMAPQCTKDYYSFTDVDKADVEKLLSYVIHQDRTNFAPMIGQCILNILR